MRTKNGIYFYWSYLLVFPLLLTSIVTAFIGRWLFLLADFQDSFGVILGVLSLFSLWVVLNVFLWVYGVAIIDHITTEPKTVNPTP